MLLKSIKAINSPYPLFIARDEENINIIEFLNGDKNNLRLTREEAKTILAPETGSFIKFAEGAVQFWKPEDEEPEVMIYFYGDNSTSMVIAPYDEFEIALTEILR